MRATAAFLLLASVTLAACGQGAAHEYPASAKARFEASCPPASDVCACTWDQVTHDMTYEEYQAALDRYRDEGLMDPRVTHARTYCLEHHDN